MPDTQLEIAPRTNIKELVAQLPIAADVMQAFGLGCSGCGVSAYETIEARRRARTVCASSRSSPRSNARAASGIVPPIDEADRRPFGALRAEFAGRAKIAHVIPIMSGKGGVGKSLVTAMIAIGLRRRHLRVGILDADITGPSIPKLFGLHEPLVISADPNKTTPQGQPQPLMTPAISRSAIEIVSSNLLTDQEDTAMVWRRPDRRRRHPAVLRASALGATSTFC